MLIGRGDGALQLAKNWIEENKRNIKSFKDLICTNSNALCKALVYSNLEEIATLKRALEKLPTAIHTIWVPAHVNVPGMNLLTRPPTSHKAQCPHYPAD